MRADVQHEYPQQVIRIDTGLMQPEMTAAWLVGSNDRWAFVETGTTRSLPLLLGVLEERGIGREQVDYVIPTHVHLDHAGGAGALVAELPAARLVIHPRGARHMVDPSRLWAGAAAVYGEAFLDRHYGALVPLPAERVIEAADGHELELGGRGLRFPHTEGHAKHHFCVWDEASRGVFTGDSFGLSLRDHDTAQGAFLYLPCAPVQFDPGAWHLTVDRLLGLEPECVYLTHYGRLDAVARLGATMHRLIDRGVELARQAERSGDTSKELRRLLTEEMLERLAEHGCEHTREQVLERLGMDIEINAQGLEVWLSQQS